MESANLNRRPLKTRSSRWAQHVAAYLASTAISPNQISVLSIVFAAAGAGALLTTSGPWPLIACAVCIQLRLACNLLDGMVAIEGGMKTRSGDILNDLPDRISDPLIIVPAGYAITALPYGPDLGWLAALIAVLTAYVRVLGHSAGTPDFFAGPMAKQHRMALMTGACALCAVGAFWSLQQPILYAGLIAIALGGVATIVRRLALIIRTLERL